MGDPGERNDLTPPPAVLAAVRAGLRPLPSAARVVLAVSGGADSVGMAWLVRAARPDLRAAVVHVRHGLRDDSADAAAAIATARVLGLGWRVIAVAIRHTGTGPEDAARRERLRALADAATTAGAAAVLVGHTADDQAETVLLNLARGSGLSGLAGIPPWRRLTATVALGRPLLGLRRVEVRAVAEQAGVPIAMDPTNTDPQQRRARARHDLLPGLAALTGGGTDPVTALARLAHHARRDTRALDALADEHLARLLGRWGNVRTVATGELDALDAAVATRIVRRLLRRGNHVPSEATVDAVLGLTDGQAASLAGGGMASRGGGYLAVSATATTALPERTGVGPIDLPEVGVTLRAGSPAHSPVLPPWSPARAAVTVACSDDAPLRVRARRAGDRITTAAGTQKLADAMIAAHVPRIARDLVPVIEDAAGIVWVPGVAVRAGTDGAACLHLARSPGQ